MSATTDKYYPICFGAIASFLYLALFSKYPKYALPANIRDLIMAATTISAIAVGFLATAEAIIVSISRSDILQWMKDGGHYETTIDYFVDAIHFCMTTAILSGLMLLIDYKDPVKIVLWVVAAWVFIAVSGLFATYRVISLFSTILKNN